MQRRKFLATVGSLTAGSAAAMSTGAFTQATARRDVSVGVTGDAAAYLELNDYSEYAYYDGGQLKLDFGELNQDADFRFYDVFQIRNPTDEPIAILLDAGGQVPDEVGQYFKGTLFDNLKANGMHSGWYDDYTNADPTSFPNINGAASAPSAYNGELSNPAHPRTWSTNNEHVITTGEALEPDFYIFGTPDDSSIDVSGKIRIIAYTAGFVQADKTLADL
ncbi:DUF1102 family protein [Halanaeroarchaeum sp. HSR-CO]|uniref:hypothetical protein n=1 Tax=Halanaeroarchaeum sp. HSR-CO TaxID=2866382 RepID=UPI00217DC650|nr:hypothetical protein [Halanaeroarchaeum sp. HSR-CO]UWG46459.1 DUF1102 family protein [Halanaeroarchaeum sp. HSR-CO]